MTTIRIVAAALLLGAGVNPGPAALDARMPEPAVSPQSTQSSTVVLAEFNRRVHGYIEVRRDVELTVPPLGTTSDPIELRRATDRLAMAVRTERQDARQGDIFTPEISAMFRRAIEGNCRGEYVELLGLIYEELEGPLPPAAVNARWPYTTALPTMPPDLLVALPPLPRELQYRFMHRDLVLHDIDANLIVDFVVDAIPSAVRTD